MSVASTPEPPAAAPAPLVIPAEFPGFRNRLARTLGRFRHKIGIFLIIGAVMTLTAACFSYGAAVLAVMLPGWRGWLAAAGAGLAGMLILVGLQAALASAAAFKIGTGQALSLGFSKLGSAFVLAVLHLGACAAASVALLAPGLALAVRFSLALPVMLGEQRTGAEALVRSRDLVYGKTLNLLTGLVAILLPAAGLPAALFIAAYYLAARLPTFALPLLPAGDIRIAAAALPAAFVWFLLLPLPMTYLQEFFEDRTASEAGRAWQLNLRRRGAYKLLAGAGGAAIALAIIAGLAVPVFIARGGWASLTRQTPSAAQTPEAPPPAPTPRDRDWERYRHLDSLRIALATYQHDNRKYPDKLEQLVPDYLERIPVDPLTGQPYEYSGSQSDFKLSFSMEQGVLTLAPGPHVVTPLGFDPVVSQPVPPATPPAPPTPAPVVSPGAPANPLPPVSPAGAIDSDNDGLSDADEKALGTDPYKPDTDGDGLADGDEVHVFGTDPLKTDTDGDGFPDGQELRDGYNPLGLGRLNAEQLAEIAAKEAQYGLHDPTPATLRPR